ncbi:N-acetyltransferase 9-like protein [Diplonema papillatum]|nr:N-acetyltransferase 9-like protein [Diplonema papillatum]|eukprot:gene16041-24563_t
MDNRNVKIVGEKAVLVPYAEEFVELYHSWMTRKELQELTCSEPLTLEEEKTNQKEWLESGEKLTFIILDKCTDTPVGDCNAFVLGDGEVEVEVMVAETVYRGKGLASNAIQLLMQYVRTALPATETFVAKILSANEPSRQLFSKLGFQHSRSVPVFEEDHYALRLTEDTPSILAVPYELTTYL